MSRIFRRREILSSLSSLDLPLKQDMVNIPPGKMKALWAEGKEAGGEPLAAYEKQDVIKSLETPDASWNATLEKTILASGITAGCINATVTTLEMVTGSPAMKKVC